MFSIIYRYRYSYYNIKEYNNLDQSARGQTDGSDLGVQYVIFNVKKVILKNNNLKKKHDNIQSRSDRKRK